MFLMGFLGEAAQREAPGGREDGALPRAAREFQAQPVPDDSGAS